MVRFRKLLLGVMAIALAVFLVAPSSARAQLTIEVSTDGGATFTKITGSSTFASGSVTTAGGTTIGVQGSSNAPSGSQTAQISQVQLAINNGGSGTDTFHLIVAVSDTNFKSPAGQAGLTSSLSGSVAAGAVTGTGTFQSIVDYNNHLFGGFPGIPGGASSGNSFSTGPQSFTITSSFNNTVTGTTIATIPFAMSNEFDIGNLSIGSGAQLGLTGTTTLAVPAPPTAVLALGGLPLLGLGGWLRRRKQD